MLIGSFGDVCGEVMRLFPPDLLEISPSVCGLGRVPDLSSLALRPLVSVGDEGHVPKLGEGEFWGMVYRHGWYNYGIGLVYRFLSTPCTEWPKHLVVPDATIVFGGALLRRIERDDQLFVVTLTLAHDPCQEALRPSVSAKWTGSPLWPRQTFVACERG